MPGLAVRAVLLALSLWLGACGAGGNNNIFDLIEARRASGGDSAGLRARAATAGSQSLSGS